MKTFKPVTGIILSAMLVTTPQIALASETKSPDTVQFQLFASELDSEYGRASVLSRMKQIARASCRSKSFTSLVRYKRTCSADMIEQWIAAVGNPALSAQAFSGSVLIARAGY